MTLEVGRGQVNALAGFGAHFTRNLHPTCSNALNLSGRAAESNPIKVSHRSARGVNSQHSRAEVSDEGQRDCSEENWLMAGHSMGREKTPSDELAKWRKMPKAPGVHERAKAFSATAPNTLERDNAFYEYFRALQNEPARSKFIRSALSLH